MPLDDKFLSSVELPLCCIQRLRTESLGGAQQSTLRFLAHHVEAKRCLDSSRQMSPRLRKSNLIGQMPQVPVEKTPAKRNGIPVDAASQSNKRARRVHMTPKFVTDSDTDGEGGCAIHATVSDVEPVQINKSSDNALPSAHLGPLNLTAKPVDQPCIQQPATNFSGTCTSRGVVVEDHILSANQPVPLLTIRRRPSSRKVGEALMPFSRKHTVDDMRCIHSRITRSIRSMSLSKKSRGSGLAPQSQDMPCQKAISWVLFQALNAPGAKILGELIRYTTSHEEWRSYMKARIIPIIGHAESGEPLRITQLVELHASATVVAGTPIAPLVNWQEQIAWYECLEEMRSLLKADAGPSREATQLKSYLDRAHPGNARYKTKLHNQIARKLGQTTSAVIRNHRWGQRLQCLTNAFGPGIMTLFGSNAMKM